MARWHQQSRKAPAQIGDLYFQKCRKASFSSHARAVFSLLARSALSFFRASPRTRLPLRNNGQRIFLSRLASSLLLALRRVPSARRTSSTAWFMCMVIWKRSSTCSACPASAARTLR